MTAHISVVDAIASIAANITELVASLKIKRSRTAPTVERGWMVQMAEYIERAKLEALG